VYFGGGGTSTSNDQFKTATNFPNGAEAYFGFPTYTTFSGTDSGSALPQVIQRNTFIGPGYRDVDLTLAKSFGLPKMPVLGENAKFEFRMDAYNVFNFLNFNPTSISTNIGCQLGVDPSCGQGGSAISNANFGRAQSALAARTITLSARFNF
jgi:hypothetical protein